MAEPECTWLYLALTGFTWLYLAVPDCTWLHMAVPGYLAEFRLDIHFFPWGLPWAQRVQH